MNRKISALFRWRPCRCSRRCAARSLGGLLVAMFVHAWDPTLAGEVVHLGSNHWTGGAEAVVVTRLALVHTSQLLPWDSSGAGTTGSDARAQTEQTLDNLQEALSAAGSSLASAVKLNVYVRHGRIAGEVVKALEHRFEKGRRPAVSLVETPLPHADALVAIDAVAARLQPAEAVLRYRSPVLKGHGVHAAVLPTGPRVYISGQAAREGDLQEAARITLERLRENLEFLGLDLSDVVQVKSFLRPASKASVVESVIRAFFGGEAPPMVFVEWRNHEPIEIELIAAAKARAGNSPPPAIEYLTPPGENASPVYSRVARLFHPSSIYLSALYSDTTGEALDQIRQSFERLNLATQGAGSDLLHLAKATYYVTTEEASIQLTEFRKGLYDPKRPPAASKATVPGTGVEGRVFTMDMIAVPAH